MTDQELIQAVLNGNKQAFGVIIKQSEGLVAQIMFKMISDAHARKDLVQEVYMRVYLSMGEFKFQSKLNTWIGGIAYKTCLKYLDKRPLGTSEIMEGDYPLMESGMETRAITQKELAGILKGAIDQLSPIFRTLVMLYHQEQMSLEEIVAVTALPEGTVKNYLYRARKLLQKSLLVKYKKEDL
ncbi:RNA polymerase sigma factor [Chitinophaga sancti]|uniref:RNA polymerase sigma factor n=1 Tax=Chitinophaga sancti TaxID=1004 RepID=UPI003F7A11B3